MIGTKTLVELAILPQINKIVRKYHKQATVERYANVVCSAFNKDRASKDGYTLTISTSGVPGDYMLLKLWLGEAKVAQYEFSTKTK